MIQEWKDQNGWDLQVVDNSVFSFQDTTATRKIFGLSKRLRCVKGGTSASKTISILIWFINYSQVKHDKPKVSSVVSESFPHLKLGAIRDFKGIMMDRGYWNDDRWNATNSTYEFETGNIIEFMSMDSYGKAHGPRRDNLFLNECNNLPWEIVDQLIIRTREVVFMDWNPVEEFWFHTEILPHRTDFDYITLNYLDNEALDAVTVSEIESHKHNERWWKVYGLGQDGTIEGRVFKNWKIIDELPHEARLVSYGIDYGYTNDPTAIVAVYYMDGGYIFDEIAYTRGLSNKKIAQIILAVEAAPVFPDSAEPKSNDELRLEGLAVMKVTKGAGSVNQGIQFVQGVKCSVTKQSVNIIKEYRNYTFMKDKTTGKFLNEPEDVDNHAMDAIRYALQVKSGLKKTVDYVQTPYQTPGLPHPNAPKNPSENGYQQNAPSNRFKDRLRLGGTGSQSDSYQTDMPWTPPTGSR